MSASNSLGIISLFFSILIVSTSAAPLEQRDVPAWLHNVFYPPPGDGSSSSQIQCYALPYGGLGIVSHALTYYTYCMLIADISPLFFKKTNQGSFSRVWNVTIAAISMIFTVLIAGFTMKSCSGEWPFALLAFWKLTLSFTFTLAALVGPFHEIDRERIIWTVVPYVLGTLAGVTGTFAIVAANFHINRNVWILTITLICCVGFAAVGFFLVGCSGDGKWNEGVGISLMVVVPIFLTFFVFFSDLVLAAVNGNWAGTPSADFAALYWIYFAFKRLPMLSF